jgi:2-alkenal reductase
MKPIMQNRIVLAIFSLSLLTFGCQLSTVALPGAVEPDTNAIVAQVVATIEAQSANNSSSEPTIETALPAIGDPLPPVELQNSLINLYTRANPAVVHIFVFLESEFLGSGTGFVIDDEGHIVTNNHVIEGGDGLEVVYSSGERSYAQLNGRDVDSDLAVLQADYLPADVQPLPLGDSRDLQVGQLVVAIGNPFGEAGSMTIGVISGLGRTIESQRVVGGGRFSIPQVIQTDAAINPGNSGGPLLNLDGEVVGVNSAILSRTGTNSGVGFSIPVNAVNKIVPALIEDGEYVYSYIGISMIPQPFTLSQLEALDLPPNGIFVTSVEPGTPAADAGLIGHNLSVDFRASGDYITAIDGTSVKTSDELLSYLVFETVPGQTVELTVIRNGEEISIPLTLGERP